VFDQVVTLQGRKYLAIGMAMQPIGWRYFRLVLCFLYFVLLFDFPA